MKAYYQDVRVLTIVTALMSVSLLLACNTVRQPSVPSESSTVVRAFEQRARDVQVAGEGVVTRILPDDNSGSRHQRFIVRIAAAQTILIQHNIDLAPRVDDLKEGDTVSFFGEYVWNAQGGLIHWTHNDPAGRHIAGWLKHKGRTYQ